MRAAALGVAVVMLIACGDDGGGGGGQPQLKTNLGIDLATVKGFVIAPVTNPAAARGMAGIADPTIDQLFTLNADGTLTKVTVTTDENGISSTTETSSPTALFDTRKHLFIGFQRVEYQGQQCSVVAVRKSDGALFCVSPRPSNYADYYSIIDSDASGDYVTMLGGLETGEAMGSVFAFDFAAGTGPIQTTLVDSATDGRSDAIAIGSRGDVLLDLRPQMNGQSLTRVYRRSGGFSSHGTGKDCYISGIGADAANFYYVRQKVGPGDGPDLHKLTWNGTSYDDTLVFADGAGAIGLGSCSAPGNASLVKSGGIIYYAPVKNGGAIVQWNYFVELVNGGTPVRHTAAAIDTIVKLYPFDTGLVILGLDPNGNSIVQRWLAAGAAYTTVLAPGEYFVSKLSAAPSGEITFSGRRLSDNVRIVGNVPAGSTTVTIVPQTFAGDVVQLQRIN